VKYVIVGAYALAFHSRPRATGDIDILIEPSDENAKKVLSVLRDFGFESLGVSRDDLLNENIVVQLGYEPNRIDLITSISGVSFQTAYNSKVDGTFGTQKAYFISLDELINNKRTAGRRKDLDDLEILLKKQKEG
jgi:hypothetical protein